jgi:hypothetical protein
MRKKRSVMPSICRDTCECSVSKEDI